MIPTSLSYGPRVLFALVAVAAASSCSQRAVQTSSSPPSLAEPAQIAASWDTLAAERDRLMNEVLRQIAGREAERAESVFKNLQMPGLKPMPAGQLVRAMNLGFARSLGVSCGHCHVANDYSSDDKPAKQKARAMIRMTNQLTQTIRAIPDMAQTATVTCTTCHRGQVKPATSLPPPR